MRFTRLYLVLSPHPFASGQRRPARGAGGGGEVVLPDWLDQLDPTDEYDGSDALLDEPHGEGE